MRRPARLVLLAASLAAWWLGYNAFAAWVQRTIGFERVTDRDLSTLLGHWFVWQLPAVLLCLAVWIAGARLGLLPSLRACIGSGGSWRRVVTSGLQATVVLLALTLGIGLLAGGTLGFHPNVIKMIGDLASNFYEELVFRGLLFMAFYGLAAGATFPLAGPLDRLGLAVGAAGSCVVFAAGHVQYPLGLRVVLGVIALVFVWPYVRARSLWAPWIPHTLGDVVADTILKL